MNYPRSLGAEEWTGLFGANHRHSWKQELFWECSKHWEETEAGVFQLATLECNSFQSKLCELTFQRLTPLIGLHPLSSAIIEGR